MFKCGMGYEEVMAMVKEMGWEVLEDVQEEEDGVEWREMTVWQADHAVALGMDDKEGVFEMEYIPHWAL